MFNKKIFLMPLLLMLAVGPLQAATFKSGYTYNWVLQSGDFKVGDTLGSSKILDYHDAGTCLFETSSWKYHGMSGSARPGYLGGDVVWSLNPGDYMTTTFHVDSRAVAFMFESDSDDGFVSIFVDNMLLVDGYDMQKLPVEGEKLHRKFSYGSLVISGLDYKAHTVKILNSSTSKGLFAKNDFHVYGAAAVPLPATFWLLASGLLGLLGLRRKS